MIFLCSYDIPSSKEGDRRRARLARFLEKYGLRVQYSVFELDIEPEKMPPLYREMEAFLKLDEDSLRIYTLCAQCAPRVVKIGRGASVERDGFLAF